METITLRPTASNRIGVHYGDELLGTVKNGGHIVRNAERVLRENRVIRTTGYDTNEARELVATGIVLSR